MDSKSCEVCQMPARHACSSCHSSFYCSKECQKKTWKKHKINCVPYAIEVHPVYGRYVVATRDIEAGEVVLKESPVAIGPQYLSRPLCLGCHRLVTGSYFCSKCNFPLCSATCELSALHEAECHIFSRAKKVACITSFSDPHPAYQCILPLRCLLTKFTDTKKWNVLHTMMDSVELLSADTKERIRRNVIEYLRNYMNLSIDDAIVYWVCGILHTNSFEVVQNGQKIEGVYPKVALMAHDCSPNTENVFDSTLKATVRTTVPIPKGTSITTTYISLLYNTLQRRRQLLISKFFECGCLRCADPKELGSQLSTLLCSQCGGQVHSSSPLQSKAVWCCDSCNYSITSKDVEQNHKILRQSFLIRDSSQIFPLEDLISLCNDKQLHSTHQIPLEVKISWIKFCGNHPKHRYIKLNKTQLQKKIIYCRELLQVGDAIFPGRSQYRGMILYELHATLRAMAKKILSVGDFNNENVQEYEDEAEKRLQEVRTIFYFKDEMKERGYEDKLTLLTEEFGSIR